MTRVAEPNFNNWIADRNPFNLPKPPQWWLQRLHDQDEALVVFPSRARVNTYVLARRRQYSKTAHDRFRAAHANVARPRTGGDSDVVAEHALVYVAHIVGGVGNWSDTIFQQLRECDTWAQGGADAVVDRIEARERVVEARKQHTLLDNLDHMARDAWRSFKARTGQRNQRSNTGPKAKIVPGALSL